LLLQSSDFLLLGCHKLVRELLLILHVIIGEVNHFGQIVDLWRRTTSLHG
jgi:hypothetical protein